MKNCLQEGKFSFTSKELWNVLINLWLDIISLGRLFLPLRIIEHVLIQLTKSCLAVKCSKQDATLNLWVGLVSDIYITATFTSPEEKGYWAPKEDKFFTGFFLSCCQIGSLSPENVYELGWYKYIIRNKWYIYRFEGVKNIFFSWICAARLQFRD